MVDHAPSRRSFFSIIAAAAVVPAAVVPAAAAAAAIAMAKPTGPMSPAEYLQEMTAIGWRPMAGDFRGRPCGVFEFGPEDHQARADSFDEFRRIQLRMSNSGDDFTKRCSVYLFERGFRVDVGKPRSVAEERLV